MTRVLGVSTLAALLGLSGGGVSLARSRQREKVVRYHGYSLRVPAAWPVFDLASHPGVCVRFDRHAVYLGAPSAQQRCPAHAAGRTESILVSPASPRAASAAARGNDSGARSVLPSAAHFSRAGGRLSIAATWRAHPAVIARALGVSSLPAAPSPHAIAAHAPARAASVFSATAASVTKGLGFDACSAPSATAMSAWRGSPYRTVGIYLGGTNMACAQPNLTASWVKAESLAGWHLIPTYVGLQAPGNTCGCASISSSRAASQGTSAAADAVIDAQAIGLEKANPIYFDLEAYPAGGSTTTTVRSFLAAWTSTLHADGYLSGVYGSGLSGMHDLVAAQGTSFAEPDDVWIADWNGAQTVSDNYVPSGDWASDQRIHQYSGATNQTYGGVRINIDGDYVDGATASAGQIVPDGTFVQVNGSGVIYRIAGGAPLPVSDWVPFGGPQPVTSLSASQFAALNQYPADGTFLLTTTGRIFTAAGGAPFAVSSWSVFGAVKPSVTIDEWAIDNISDPLSHLRSRPANGTLVEGLPSRTYWRFESAGRMPIAPTTATTPVPDASLKPYALLAAASAPAPRCVAPALHHLTLTRARAALTRAHCRLGHVRRPHSVPHGRALRVAAQTPRAGAKHSAGYKVGIWLR